MQAGFTLWCEDPYNQVSRILPELTTNNPTQGKGKLEFPHCSSRPKDIKNTHSITEASYIANTSDLCHNPMLNCFQFVVRNHRGQERALLHSYYISSHCTHKHRSTPTCTLTQCQLRVVSQELQLSSQPANKKDALRNSAVFLSMEMLVGQAKGWSNAERNTVVFSGSLLL